jgi:hypothetical protein
LKSLSQVSILLFHINLSRTNVPLGMSVTALRLEIAREEASLAETAAAQPHEMTPSMLVQTGLELEEQQCVPYNR